MKLSPRKNVHKPETRRDRLLVERDRSISLARMFPGIERLRIDLAFSEDSPRMPLPSSQLHTLFGTAAAFFRFPCPCSDCDGDFDLTNEITQLFANKRAGRRSASRSGQLACSGERFRTHPTLHVACPMRLTFTLTSELQRTE
jgi:hypothetical protein